MPIESTETEGVASEGRGTDALPDVALGATEGLAPFPEGTGDEVPLTASALPVSLEPEGTGVDEPLPSGLGLVKTVGVADAFGVLDVEFDESTGSCTAPGDADTRGDVLDTASVDDLGASAVPEGVKSPGFDDGCSELAGNSGVTVEAGAGPVEAVGVSVIGSDGLTLTDGFGGSAPGAFDGSGFVELELVRSGVAAGTADAVDVTGGVRVEGGEPGDGDEPESGVDDGARVLLGPTDGSRLAAASGEIAGLDTGR